MIFSLFSIQEAQYQERQQKIRSFCQVLKMQGAHEHGERQNVPTLSSINQFFLMNSSNGIIDKTANSLNNVNSI